MAKQYNIPSSIASKLEQIKLYMGTHSVTAFVGAGFSLNAEIPSNVKMKTWKQLRETFFGKPYPNNEEDRLKDGNDVVRFASLVDAEFGHNEVDNILSSVDEMIEKFPTFTEAYYHGAVVSLKSGDREKAKELINLIDEKCKRTYLTTVSEEEIESLK